MTTVNIYPDIKILTETLAVVEGKTTISFVTGRKIRHKKFTIVISSPLVVNQEVIFQNKTGGPIIFTAASTLQDSLFKIQSRYAYFRGGHDSSPFIFQKAQTLGNGGAIQSTVSDSFIIVRDTIFRENKATFGGAICSQGTVMIKKSYFIKNQADLQGGAIWAGQGLLCERSELTKNKTIAPSNQSAGGAVYVDSGYVRCLKSSFVENRCQYVGSQGGSGGAIVLMQGPMQLIDCKIKKNSAWNSAAIQQGIGNVYLIRSSVDENRSYNSATGAAGGGGLTISNGDVFVTDSSISYNKTLGMFSGGILSLIGNVSLSDQSQVNGNSNKGPGGGLAQNFGGNLSVEKDCEIKKNTGASLGGALVNFGGSGVSVTVSSSEICENTLTDAQTIGQTLSIFADAVSQYANNLSSQASLFQPIQPSANAIQALSATLIQNATTLVGELADEKLNLQSIGGAAIATLLPCTISLTKTKIEENQARSHSGVDSQGGGIFAWTSPITLNRVKIKENVVKSQGSGIFYGTGPLAQDEDTQVYGNKSLNLKPPTSSQIFQAS